MAALVAPYRDYFWLHVAFRLLQRSVVWRSLVVTQTYVRLPFSRTFVRFSPIVISRLLATKVWAAERSVSRGACRLCFHGWPPRGALGRGRWSKDVHRLRE